MSIFKNQVIEIYAGPIKRGYWLEIWHHRELLMYLALRDILVRYKQTIIGIAWVILKPLLMMVVFNIVFSKVLNISTELPYPLVALAGLLPWQFISSALTESSNSLVANGNLITKAYFPRLVMPLSTVFVNLVDFFISLILLFSLMIWYGVHLTWHILFLPALLLISVILILSIGIWLSALTVRYRDFKILIPFGLQLATYISPIAYPSSLVPEKWRLLYYLNPIAGLIDGYRWAILGEPINAYGIGLTCVISAFFLYIGFRYFRRSEKSFPDYL